jgi:deaminated glutathione amidase
VTTINLALVQKAASLDAAENRAALAVVTDALAVAAKPADLVVFPEAFMRDFGKPGSDISKFAEPMDGPYVDRLTGVADQHNVTIIAGMFEVSEDSKRPYNTLAVVDKFGLRATYRKIHLYDSFGYKESDRLLSGAIEPVVVEVGGFKVGLMTCYDLRFPELARELTKLGADLIVVPAAWVTGPGKVDHWRTLVKARAIENTVFLAAAGQPGPRYTGHSMVVGPDGQLIAEVGDGDRLLQASLDLDQVEEARSTNPSLANRRF